MSKYLTIYDKPIVEILPKSTRGRFKIYVPIKHELINGRELVIPINYISNGASIPKLLRGLFSQQGVYLMPSIIHDYLYDNNLYSRKLADRQFLIDMGRLNTKPLTKWVFYYTIRLFGWINWNKNKEI